MNNNKKTPEPSRFAKKADELKQKINTHYNKPKKELHPHSFTANQYRIFLLAGIILMVVIFFRGQKSQNANVPCKNEDGMFKNLSSTVTESKDSLYVLYNLYKNGGLDSVSDFAKIRNVNPNQRFYVNVTNRNEDDQKNALICGEKFSVKIGISKPAALEENVGDMEYKTYSLTVGERVEENPNLEHAFLQLSEKDEATIVLNTENSIKKDETVVFYIKDVVPSEAHMVGFYEVYNIFDGTGDILKCEDKFFIMFEMNDISENKIIHSDYKLESEIDTAPIILQRVLAGKPRGSKVKVVTKAKNLCIFKGGMDHDLCHKFWKIGDHNLENIVVLTINLHGGENK